MGSFRRIKAALIGSGAISEKYLGNIINKFHVIDLVGCSDIIPERSKNRADEFGIRQMTNDEILNDPEIEIVINTTYPLSHYAVTKDALLAEKHVYSEKMLAVTLEEGRELVELAEKKHLHFTVAPDTILGGGWQTIRNIIDSGWIGDPITANCVCIRSYQDHGDALANPKPFVFSHGGGIPFDMGGYYLHNLINLLGSIRRVSGFMQTRNPNRMYTNPRHPKFGGGFEIETPNTLVGSLEFANGTLGSLTITSESSVFTQPRFEIHGTQGSLYMFDPNDFGGEIKLKRNTNGQPESIPQLFPFVEENRGIGVADMAYGIINDRRSRVDVSMGFHAFEAVHGICSSCDTGQVYIMSSKCERPEPLKLKALAGTAYETILND